VDILEPVVAVLIGETVLGEELHVSGGILAVEAIAGAVAATGIVCLTTSKVVLSIYEEPVASDDDAQEVDATPQVTAPGVISTSASGRESGL
jgi:hypothetical protein